MNLRVFYLTRRGISDGYCLPSPAPISAYYLCLLKGSSIFRDLKFGESNKNSYICVVLVESVPTRSKDRLVHDISRFYFVVSDGATRYRKSEYSKTYKENYQEMNPIFI